MFCRITNMFVNNKGRKIKVKCKNTIKFIVTLALAFFLIAAVTSNVKVTASTQPSTLEYYLQYQLSSDKVDDTQKESLQKIIEVRKITEQQVLDSLKKATAEFILLAPEQQRSL